MNIDKNDFWDENYYNHPPIIDAMIVNAEEILGVKLPELLIKLLRIQNGGYVADLVFPMKEPTSWAENHIALSEMFGIVTDKSIETTQNLLDSEYVKEWGIPEKQVLLSGDGHWWITLDYRNGDNPTVRWIDLECNQDIHMADSFEGFINGLVSGEKFVEN
jgi:SMI1/KNR4 family protein SUKH-1